MSELIIRSLLALGIGLWLMVTACSVQPQTQAAADSICQSY